MDIDDCFNILKNRVVCEGHSCVQALCQNEFITPGISKSNLVSNALVPHDLIGQFLRLQEERVQVLNFKKLLTNENIISKGLQSI